MTLTPAINATQSASDILRNNPDAAQDLMDVVIKAATEPGFKDSGEYDDILNLCWVKMQQCRVERDRHIASRAAA
jgi:hypothetical protein